MSPMFERWVLGQGISWALVVRCVTGMCVMWFFSVLIVSSLVGCSSPSWCLVFCLGCGCFREFNGRMCIWCAAPTVFVPIFGVDATASKSGPVFVPVFGPGSGSKSLKHDCLALLLLGAVLCPDSGRKNGTAAVGPRVVPFAYSCQACLRCWFAIVWAEMLVRPGVILCFSCIWAICVSR